MSLAIKKTPGYIGRYDVKELDYLKPSKKPYTVISLFSGCGGFDVGSAQAGFQTRVMIDWDKAACKTLRVNFTMKGHILECCEKKSKKIKDHAKCGPRPISKKGGWYHKPEPVILHEDITKLSSKKILEAARLRVGECTFLTGGFPCQGFSIARNIKIKKWQDDKRNFLYLECVRIIKETLPKTFCLENVPGLVSMQKGAVIKMICKDLSAIGYNVNWYKLNAADYGVPQHRIRIFIFGRRNDVMVFKGKGKVSQLHIAGLPGKVTHPEWFIKKYEKSKTQRTT